MIKDIKFFISASKNVTNEINKHLDQFCLPDHIIVGIHHELVSSYRREVTIYYRTKK